MQIVSGKVYHYNIMIPIMKDAVGVGIWQMTAIEIKLGANQIDNAAGFLKVKNT